VRGTLLLLSIALILGAFAALLGQTADVGGVGAPTDNSTIPNSPAIDQSQDEIKPSVNYVLQGPTSQSKSTPPNFIPSFIATSEEDKFKVTANETWYLDVDVNTPGWLYIYEYFPVGEDLQGKWIAYKWQLLQSGLWKLGPFTPENNEPEGQHIYRIWFYSDGQWAEEDPNATQNNLVFWTYSKGQIAEQPAEQVPPQPLVAPVKETTLLDQLHGLITPPMVLWFGPLAFIVIVMLGLYLFWRYARRARSKEPVSLPDESEFEVPSAVLPSVALSAKIALPNGLEIQIAGKSRVIGRVELARALGLDELGLISRRHFEVRSECEQFYIEDLGSANGTRLNGADIKGKGPVSLNNDDVIEPAGAISLKFYVP
jgi:hypothetical protein